MKFTIMGYMLDTDDTDNEELYYMDMTILYRLIKKKFPNAGIDNFIYHYDKDGNYTCVCLFRDADHLCSENWIKEEDFRLIIGSDDTQTFQEAMTAIHEGSRNACRPVNKYADGCHYIKRSKVEKYFMDHFVESGVKSVDICFDNKNLFIMLNGY